MVFTKIKSRQPDILLSKLKEISAGADCTFPYRRTMLHAYLVKVELQYQKVDNHKFIMKSPILLAWMYRCLISAEVPSGWLFNRLLRQKLVCCTLY